MNDAVPEYPVVFMSGGLPAEATWPREVKEIAARLTRDPTHIQVGCQATLVPRAEGRKKLASMLKWSILGCCARSTGFLGSGIA